MGNPSPRGSAVGEHGEGGHGVGDAERSGVHDGLVAVERKAAVPVECSAAEQRPIQGGAAEGGCLGVGVVSENGLIRPVGDDVVVR